MQLFGNTNNKNKKNTPAANREFIEGRISGFTVAIVSTRTDVVDQIRSILFLYNVLSIEVLLLEYDEIKEDPRWSEFDIFIIDIGHHNDAEKISENINRCIPIKSTTILFGSHDSIIFSDLLSKKGIFFLLDNKQLENIPNILHIRSVTPPGSSKRVGSVVSFLGCKGGVGTSSLIVHTLKNISKSTNYPISYIQGASTSRNVDFLFEAPVDRDGSFSQIDESIQVKVEQESEAWRYDYLNSGAFNITVLDQNMGLNSSLIHLENIVSFSNIVFLVLNRDPYSVKVAKTLLEEIGRISQKDIQILNKRFLVCVNDNHPFDKSSSLQNEDIEEYLGRPIDFTRKYIASIEKFKKSHSSAEIDRIAAAVIGAERTKKSSFIGSLMGRRKNASRKKG